MKLFTIVYLCFSCWNVACIDAEDEICPTLKELRNVGLVRAHQMLAVDVTEYSAFQSHFHNWMLQVVNYPKTLEEKQEKCNDETIIADFEHVKSLVFRMLDGAYELQLQTWYNALASILDVTKAPMNLFLASGKPSHELERTRFQMTVPWKHWRPILTKLKKLCQKEYHFRFRSKNTNDDFYVGRIPTKPEICDSKASTMAFRLTEEIDKHPFWRNQAPSAISTLNRPTPDTIQTTKNQPDKAISTNTPDNARPGFGLSFSFGFGTKTAMKAEAASTGATGVAISPNSVRKRKGSEDSQHPRISELKLVSTPSKSLLRLPLHRSNNRDV